MIKLVLAILTTISFSVFASEASHEGAHEIRGKSGANLTLFPTKQQDVAKKERPAKPKLSEPGYKTVVKSDSVVLKWENVETANAYHVQVATDPAFKWLVSDNWNVTGNSFEQKELKPGTSYFWRVAAIRSANEATFMKGWFSVNTFVTK